MYLHECLESVMRDVRSNQLNPLSGMQWAAGALLPLERT